MTQNKNYGRAYNFHQRYTSDLKNSPALNDAFRQRISQTRKHAGPVFEKFLVELKKKIDTSSVDDQFVVSKEEYHDIKEYMLNINSVDVDYFNKILEDLIYFRLLPADFDDWDYEFHHVDDIPIIFTAIRHGYIPEGFYQWHLENIKHMCIAHLAALNGLLPATFKDWNLTDYNGYTVSDVIRFNLFEKIYIRNN